MSKILNLAVGFAVCVLVGSGFESIAVHFGHPGTVTLGFFIGWITMQEWLWGSK